MSHFKCIEHIHVAVLLSPPSISRTFSSPQLKLPPLDTTSPVSFSLKFNDSLLKCASSSVFLREKEIFDNQLLEERNRRVW
jgi:hypothetical protein